MKTKYKLLVTILLVCAAASAAIGYCLLPKTQEMSYKEFIDLLNNNKIQSATISDDFIICSLVQQNDNTSDTKLLYKTVNPQSPTLYEKLLLNGVTVKTEQNLESIISLVLDILFYGVFIVIIFTVFKKFISPNTFKVVTKTNTKFTDIVGLNDLKKVMLQLVSVLKNPKEYSKKGIRMPKGILLEGDPGNGKTLFARALAGEAGINFIPAKATDFESMLMAIGPAKVKLLFKKARKKAPCIVFIDEFDGIGTKRSYSGSGIETENTRIVTALLNELDGFTQNDGVLVIAATNSRKALDEALIRPGRFDAKYLVPYPDFSSRIELIKMYTQNKNLEANLDIEKLSRRFEKYSCAQIESVLNRAAMISSQKEKDFIDFSDIETAIKEQ